MDAVERAVRAALERGDVEDRGFRARIYGSAQSALERSLAAKPLPQQEVDARRRKLAVIIASIESEFAPAVMSPSPPAYAAPAVQAAAQTPAYQSPAYQSPAYQSLAIDVPAHDAPPVSAAHAGYDASLPDDAAVSGDVDQQRVAPAARLRMGRPAKPLRSAPRRPSGAGRWLVMAANGAFLVALFLAGWWAYGEASRLYAQATDRTPPGVRPALAETPTNGAPVADTRAWINVFQPQEADRVTVPAGANAELTSRDGAAVLSISAEAPDAAIVFSVGRGILDSIKGKRVLFNIRARAEAGRSVDMGLGCALGGLATCERKRFSIAPESAEYMFAITLAAAAPEGDGTLSITPDLTGQGGRIDIEQIRVSVIEAE